MNKTFFILLFSLGWFLSLAQQRCANNTPFSFTASKSISPRTNDNVVWVVFHILYRDSMQNISDAQILSQLEVLNQDFGLNNENRHKIPAQFQQVEADIGLQFCLAETAPDGSTSDGIQRKQTDLENIGERVGTGGRRVVKHEGLGGIDAWDSERYLNVWVCEHAVYGEATFPNQGRPDEQGILIDYRAFGGIPASYKNEDTQKGHVLTHEIGHYLGLNHLWGTEGSSCTADDGIEDTPLQQMPNFGCPEIVPQSCGSADMIHNFMDFTNDECLAFFTTGQKERMWAILNQERQLLLQSGCTVSTNAYSQQTSIFPTLTQDFIHIESDKTIQRILVYSMDGCRVHQSSHKEKSIEVDLTPVARGMYVVQVWGSHSLLKVQKVLLH